MSLAGKRGQIVIKCLLPLVDLQIQRPFMLRRTHLLSVCDPAGQAKSRADWKPARLIYVVLSFAILLIGIFPGCTEPTPPAEAFIWGRKGLDDGRFIKPRAISIDTSDQLYIVDMTSRIQVFDRDGQLLRSWKTPECLNGKPCGISVLRDGRIAVPDTHYFRVLFYTPQGELLEDQTIGGTNGRGPSQFGFLTDVVEDSQGNLYVSEYGDFDRIQKFDPDGKFICAIGTHGSDPGMFLRPQGMTVDEQDRLWVADACNHRIQVFDAKQEPPAFLFQFGEHGDGQGQLSYPYNISMDGQGFIYVCEFGNHRIQKFDLEGNSHGYWGGPGREPGQMHQPWGFAVDTSGFFHVIDSYNHRVQRFKGLGETPEQSPDCWNTDDDTDTVDPQSPHTT